MKIIFKSPSTIIGIALITGVVLAFLFSFVNMFVVMNRTISDIAKSIGYELRIAVDITNTSVNRIDINDTKSLEKFLKSLQLMKIEEIRGLLKSKEFVNEVNVLVPLSFLTKSVNTHENIGILFLGIEHKKLPLRNETYCVALSKSRLLNISLAKLYECNDDAKAITNNLLNELSKGWTRYEIKRYFGPFGTYTITTTISPPLLINPQIVVLTSYENLPNVIMKVMNGLKLSSSLRAYATIVLLIDISELSYLNPISISSSIDKIIELTDDIERDLSNYKVVIGNGEVISKLNKITMFESISRVALVMGMIPALIMLIIVSRSIIESAILSMRRYVALAKLRGVNPRKFSLWILYSAILWVIMGIGLAYLCTILISRILIIENWNLLISSIFSDPIIIGGVIALSTIIIVVVMHKYSTTISKLPPIEAVKTTIAPEELLGKERIGAGTLILLALGLYHVVSGLLGFSASSYLAKYGAELMQNFVVLIVLTILAMIEGFTKPFAPAFYAYSIAKILSAKSDKVLKVLNRVVSALSGKLEIAVKGLILLKKRRFKSILMLIIFSLSILIGSYLSSTSSYTLLDSATIISIGSDYHALKSFDNLTSALEVSKHIDKYDKCTTIIELHGSYTIQQEVEIPRGITLLIIMNINKYLNNTYWTESLGIEKDFSHIIRNLSKEKSIALIDNKELTPFASRVINSIESSNRLALCISDICVNEAVEVIGKLSFIPGFISKGDVVVVTGPWILNKVSKGKYIYTTLHIFCKNSKSEDISSDLERMGFSIISKEKVISSSDYKIFSCLISMAVAISLPQSLVLIGLSIVLSGFISWSASKEVSKIYLLLRIRGARSRDILRIILLEWGFLIIISIALSIALGISMGLGAMTLATFPSIPLNIEVDDTYITIDLSKGSPNPYIPIEGWLTIIMTILVLILVPSLSAVMVYRGTVRERFLEVR